MFQLDDVALFLGKQGRNPCQLTRLIRKQHRYGEYTVPLDQAVLYNGGHGDDVHVAAA